jgi:hypothetical protein
MCPAFFSRAHLLCAALVALFPACGARSDLLSDTGEDGDGGAQPTSGGAAGSGGDGGSAGSDATGGAGGTSTLEGPVHTFAGLSSSFYVTQFMCTNSGGDPAGDAEYFCTHFYSTACTAVSWTESTSTTNPQMHSGINCNEPDPNGIDVPGTSCVGGPCKIGDYTLGLGGLSNLVCACP